MALCPPLLAWSVVLYGPILEKSDAVAAPLFFVFLYHLTFYFNCVLELLQLDEVVHLHRSMRCLLGNLAYSPVCKVHSIHTLYLLEPLYSVLYAYSLPFVSIRWHKISPKYLCFTHRQQIVHVYCPRAENERLSKLSAYAIATSTGLQDGTREDFSTPMNLPNPSLV